MELLRGNLAISLILLWVCTKLRLNNLSRPLVMWVGKRMAQDDILREPEIDSCWDLSFLDVQIGSMNSMKMAMRLGV